ncbi:hypothetical protein GCM10022421_11420 [Oceanisphaera sediminis]|uniref:Uncharacterized protein n=1 Tax=Oceanisphaera sediminis TaxID=981381 RepID=A0ABP7DKZ4_9GAMM
MRLAQDQDELTGINHDNSCGYKQSGRMIMQYPRMVMNLKNKHRKQRGESKGQHGHPWSD